MAAVCVIEEEGDEVVELPLEEDGTLLLSTLQAQFYGCTGLKYRNPSNKAFRGVRLIENKLHPFDQDQGWADYTYICVFPKENKRKSDDRLEDCTPKTKRVENRMKSTTDLIVLGLPWKTTEDTLKEYFEGFGELLVCQIKKDTKTGQSKGFGFIRFNKYESQMKVLTKRHLIDGRTCDVKIPSSKDQTQHQMPSKIFLGRVTEDMTPDDIREYFSKFGEVTDVFIPKPFRAFAFVTFIEPEIAQSLCGEDHLINGNSVYVSTASPRPDQNRQNRNQMSSSSNYEDRSGRGGHSNIDYSNQLSNSNSNSNFPNSGYNNMPPNQQPVWNYSEYSQNRQSNKNNDSMPNLQALGLNSSGPSSGGNIHQQGMSNHLSGGNSAGIIGSSHGHGGGQQGGGGGNMNLNQMPINPAIIAAALSQWSLQMHSNPQNGPAPGVQNQHQSGSGGQDFMPWLGQGGPANVGSNNGGLSTGGNAGAAGRDPSRQ